MSREPRVTVTQDKAAYDREQEMKDAQSASKKALEALPEQSILEQHTDIPVGPDPEQLKARQDQEKLEKKQADMLYKQAQDAVQRSDDAHASGHSKAKDWKDSDFFPVRLLKAYVPMEAYQVVEAQTKYTRTVPAGRTHDKVQADQVIGLPTAEAKKIIGVKIAERADEIK